MAWLVGWMDGDIEKEIECKDTGPNIKAIVILLFFSISFFVLYDFDLWRRARAFIERFAHIISTQSDSDLWNAVLLECVRTQRKCIYFLDYNVKKQTNVNKYAAASDENIALGYYYYRDSKRTLRHAVAFQYFIQWQTTHKKINSSDRSGRCYIYFLQFARHNNKQIYSMTWHFLALSPSLALSRAL